MFSKPISRRTLLLGSGAVGLSYSLAGCSSSSSGSSSPSGAADGSAQLDVALWGDAKRADLYESALDLFAKSHEGVTAKLQFADLDPYLERLATSAAAKDLPDVLWMRDTHIGRYGSAGSLLDLTPYLGKVINTDTIGDSGVATGRIGDGVFALPTHYVGQAIIHNTTMFAAKDVDIATIKTWDDLAQAATTLTSQNDKVWGLSDPTLGQTHRHLEAWIRQSGQEVFTDEGGVGFEADVVAAWFEYWSKLRAAGVIPAADVQIEADSGGWTSNLLVTGRAAMVAASTNHLTAVQELSKTPFALSSIPQLPDGTQDWWFFPPILISAAANTDNPDRAAELINFFINDTEAGVITGLSQGAPSSAPVREKILPTLNEQQSAFIEQISREQKQPSRPFPIRPEGAEQFNTALTRTGQEIAYGRKSVSEAVANLMEEARRALSA